MPKQVVEIRKFTKGMVTNVDVTDPSIDTPIYTKGLETVNHAGALSGAQINEDIISGLKIDAGISIKDEHDDDVILIIDIYDTMYWLYDVYGTPYVISFLEGYA